jgi:hypothetical protein
MARMPKRRPNPLVAWCAVLALLLCQAAGLIDARVVDWTVAQPQGGGCHSAAAEDGQSGKTVHIPCDSAQSVGETFKLPSVTPALLGFAAGLLVCTAHANLATPFLHLAHAGAPPPLHLLYARLRN